MKGAAPPMPPDVARAFDGFPAGARAASMDLRDLIFETAGETAAVGAIVETLKWGQPSYLPAESRSGTTVRLGVPKDGGLALYVHCQTTLVADFRSSFPTGLRYEGTRAIRIDPADPPDRELVRRFVRAALTYHLDRERL